MSGCVFRFEQWGNDLALVVDDIPPHCPYCSLKSSSFGWELFDDGTYEDRVDFSVLAEQQREVVIEVECGNGHFVGRTSARPVCWSSVSPEEAGESIEVGEIRKIWNRLQRSGLHLDYPVTDLLERSFLPGRMLKKDVWVDDNAEIAADARLIGPLLISSNSHVMSGATCGPNALIVSSTVYKKTIAAGVALVHNKIVAAGDMPSSPVRMVAENLSTSEVSHTESKALELVREGRFHISQGEFLRAVDSYKAAFEIEKEFAGASGAYMDLGVTLKDLAEYEEAEYYLRKSVELDTSNGDAWFNLGSLLTRKLGRHGDAVESLKNAVNCNPDDEDAICFAVEAMLRLNRTGDAIAFLDDCIRRSTRLKKVEALRIQIAADFRQWLEDIAAGRRPNI